MAPGRGQRRRRSWPGQTETHVAVRYHPRSEISDSFPSPSSSVKLSPVSASLCKRLQLWEFTGHFHTKMSVDEKGVERAFFHTQLMNLLSQTTGGLLSSTTTKHLS